MKFKALAVSAAVLFTVSFCGCVDQHPEKTADSQELRLIATSPAVADITDKLELDLVGVCSSSISTISERYDDAKKIGTAMSPDTEIVKSLDADWILSPSSLQGDLQPKYAAIGTKSIFLNLKSVEGMYQSIDELGELFYREEQAQALIDEYEALMNTRKRMLIRKNQQFLCLWDFPARILWRLKTVMWEVLLSLREESMCIRAKQTNFSMQTQRICRSVILILSSDVLMHCLMT